jgi:hypothetical protein
MLDAGLPGLVDDVLDQLVAGLQPGTKADV